MLGRELPDSPFLWYHVVRGQELGLHWLGMAFSLLKQWTWVPCLWHLLRLFTILRSKDTVHLLFCLKSKKKKNC